MDELTILQAEVLKTLASPRRLEILHRLAVGPSGVGQLADDLCLSQPNVSQHLAILQRDGLVRRYREDGHVLWEVVDRRLAEACALIDEILGPQLAQK